ncbi:MULTISPECIES: alpha/beta fold hydrolase [Kitasatospora]|uniref:Pimeloyl-ACP methyl ester carboxylesterase n=2 Tax=Kitasatospora TaxID=2063 RepID=A0ABT1J8A7_9ACTN|nr:alpha/beta hydrolase [Kitasatospora paracochleata]MCP2313348.1 pimeloyl-ACP methyl ester carboxylesterase [Kitasatospora paracochleata]
MPTVSAGNANVHYRVNGTGPGLVFVHGTGFGAEGTWGHLAENFTDSRTVILPDFSGCGETTDDGGELTVEQLAAQIIGVIEDAGDGPVDLVGFSLGAVVSATVAALRPDLVRRLVLTAGWTRPDDAYLSNHMTTWKATRGDAEAFGRFGTLTAFSRDFLAMIGPEQVEAIVKGNQPSEGALRHIEVNLRTDIRDLLPKIEAETLVVGCGKDHTVPVELHRELAEAVQGSTYVELDSGHVVVFEKGAEYVELVKGFLLKD